MLKPELNGLNLLAVLIAGALFSRFGPGPNSWMAALAGAVLLIILFAYEGSGEGRTFWQSAGFAGAAGFCLILILVPALHYLGLGGALNWPVIIWGAGMILFLIIDRAGKPAPAPAYQPSRNEPPEPLPLSETPNMAPPPNAIPLPARAGKPATIYLNLMGEGLVCLRPVQAEHMGKDYYRIVESVPEGEAWEYQPGQIVRCQKKNLSSGKALVAIEEAPRAR